MTEKQTQGGQPNAGSRSMADPAQAAAGHVQSPPSLDHGAASLVAQDNPDDSQLGAPELGQAGAKNP